MKTHRLTRLVALAGVLAGSTQQASACASCGCGDPTLSALGTEQPFANRLRAALELRYRTSEFGAGTGSIQIREERLDVQLAWAPLQRLFLLATVPGLRRQVTYAGLFGRTSWGLGDIELRAKLFVYQDRAFAARHRVAVLAGVKLPSAARERTAAGDLLPIEAQPGTGSVDPLVGLSYTFSAFPWLLYASANMAIPTSGTGGYRASRSLRNTLAVQRQVIETLAVRLALDSRLDGYAIEHGGQEPDSGGFILFASPELLYSPVMDLTLSVVAHLTVANDLNGRQKEPFVLAASVAYDF